MLDKNSKKVLKFFIKNNKTLSYSELATHFDNYFNLDLIDILNSLCKEDYLRIISDSKYYITNKGKTYKSLSIKSWLSEHLIETLALIVSILALILSIVSLVVSLLLK